MSYYRSNYHKTYPARRNRASNQFGYIYFIRNTETKRTKIGKTVDVPARLSSLQTANDSRLELVRYIAVPKETMSFWERAIQDSVRDLHFSGEWFDIPEEDLQQTIRVYQKLVFEEYL